MKIIIDADGCPVVDIAINVARKFKVEPIIMCDTAHIFNKPGVQVIILGKGADAVDFAIVNKLNKNDIVITQDYGLAAMVLSKGGYAINQNGWIYNDENIEQLLFTRYISKKARNSGERVKGNKKRRKEDNIKFQDSLIELCEKLLNIPKY
ncbi:YaiI/YqxD family protein [Romboutsia sp.]|uniref:YaiI/YqxD family protein n=1 Tax=Romboutsia sp. TaxID=1965302 RepID=UPI003F30D8C0